MNLIFSGWVDSEGDELYFEVRGVGQAILMIPPAGGDGDLYAAVADLLSNKFKVITYDRRANARSTMNHPQNFEISQQSRDAAVIIRAAGEESAVVFGNSSGAVIALDMARTHPQAVRAIIAHEPPLPALHPEREKWQRFFARCYITSFQYGSSFAAYRFMRGIEVPLWKLMKAQMKASSYAKKQGKTYNAPRVSPKAATDFLMKKELLPVTNYEPDTDAIRRNRVKAVIGAGEWSLEKKTWYAQSAKLLAQQLGCELTVFPGHHGSFMDRPAEWAAVLEKNLLELK
ncbi:alpha/beta fold hydrolase [Planococcus shixiaomingii]|uniref:alpha/beta fold hydrolase n=1 Tax=Planococcus shixiaomingii TaxID=3058393 RepID=UPI0026193C19|nr:alpha/beta hydrolase [Planococcus sp. N022]WKA55703.1 alpha/beta hydrolase [Planococcus sp. N022]